MSEFEGFPPCKHCHHPADSHDEEFGNCEHLQNQYGMNQWDGCECPGYEETELIDLKCGEHIQ